MLHTLRYTHEQCKSDICYTNTSIHATISFLFLFGLKIPNFIKSELKDVAFKITRFDVNYSHITFSNNIYLKIDMLNNDNIDVCNDT